MSDKQAAPKAVAIKLGQAHIHQRTDYKAGETIHVLPHVADYLVARKIGERA